MKTATKEDVRAFLVDAKDRAERVRIGIPGTLVAHYTSAATVFEHILPTRKLRLSAFALMSDPRENKDWVSYAVNRRVGSAGSPRTWRARYLSPSLSILTWQRSERTRCVSAEPRSCR